MEANETGNSKPREGWEEMLKEELAKNGQSQKLIPDVFEDENINEWTW